MAQERFFINSAVRGFHVYKDYWNPTIGETLLCDMQFGDIHDPYVVAVVRGVDIVGHIPRKLSSLCHFFSRNNGTISCQVTGSRCRSIDLPQGGLEVPCMLTFVVVI